MPDYLLFESTLADGPKWTAAGNVVEPAGYGHARLLAAHLPESIHMTDGPWNEEDYAWEFLVKCNTITVCIHITENPDEGWEIAVIPVSFFAFFRRNKINLAVDKVSEAIENILRTDTRFKNVRRYTEAQRKAREEVLLRDVLRRR